MNNIENIKRIRWADVNGRRWYGFSVAICAKEKMDGTYGIGEPIKADNNWCNLTDQGRKIVNKLLNTKGIRYINAGPFGILVEKQAIFSWDDFHPDVLELINKTLFAGKADVDVLGARKSDEGLIRWSGKRKETTRWYGVSTPLTVDEKEKASFVVSQPIPKDKTYGLTPAAREVANAIFAKRGVLTVWVNAFGISVEIAPVFTFSDYHNDIIALLTDKIFGGKAFVEERSAA